jgi:alkylated DNA repair protein (DNA oxidative demethylase)
MLTQLSFGLGSAPAREEIGVGAWLLRGFALPDETALLEAIDAVAEQAPFRHMTTPGNLPMSVAMTSCGPLGWTSSAAGYRYVASDPVSGVAWPAMPAVFLALATHAADAAGYAGFLPDACLVNRYAPAARMGLHQDRDEQDLTAPIVSVSLGLPATFLFGGLVRSERPKRIAVEHGDVVVWGGPTRLAYHGVAPLADGEHPRAGRRRYNLTFRRARGAFA